LRSVFQSIQALLLRLFLDDELLELFVELVVGLDDPEELLKTTMASSGSSSFCPSSREYSKTSPTPVETLACN
jgi:hypothetical protein